MATEKINMPQLGESVTEGTISYWLVGAGDKVNKYDPIAEVMTDKVNAEVPSSLSGGIQELAAQGGATMPVCQVRCYIDTEGRTAGDESKTSDQTEKKQNAPAAREEDSSSDHSLEKRYSPAVMSLGQETDIDLQQV